MSELHGVETLEYISGAIAVTTVSTAVIGLVGTAPDAQPATAATGESGSVLLKSRLQFVAAKTGRTGNILKVNAVAATPSAEQEGKAIEPQSVSESSGKPESPRAKKNIDPQPPAGEGVAVLSAELADAASPTPTTAEWSESKDELLIKLGIDAEGKITATAADVVTAVAALEDSGITVALSADSDGSGTVSPFYIVLSGGEDEPFPLNTPVVMAGGIGQASKLGTTGSLYDELNDIFDQFGALVITVRADTKDSPEEQRAAVLAAMDGFVKSKSITTYQPRILIAPSFSADDAVAKELETKAAKLRAIAYVDSAAGATVQDVVKRRDMFGERVELMRPRVQVADSDGQLVYKPYSARAAGLRARIDNQKGWWWSKSNQDIYNILGVEQVDEWSLSDANCTANLLNMDNVSTIIRHDGFKHWGNRLCSTHPQLRFESVRRTADIIEDSIQEAMMPYLDQPLDKWVRDDILESINSYLRYLTGMKAIFGGRAWLNVELNTAETLAAGLLYIDYDFGPKSPLERLTLTANPTNNSYALAQMMEAA